MGTPVVLITGASSGIGEACAKHLHQRGYKVYGASRSSRRQGANDFNIIRMDVTQDDCVDGGVRQIMEREGRIEVLVNCAGFGIAGSVEDTTVGEAKAQFETNFFGILRLCKSILPVMRQQKSGLIVNISSIAGLLSIPFQGFYSASKFAVEGLTEALRMEVKPFGIRVVLIEPGDFKTDFTANRKKTLESQASPIYQGRFHKALSVMEKYELNGPSPVEVAHLLEQIIKNPSPKLRYSAGPLSERVAPVLKQILPYKLYELLLMRYFEIR